MKILDIKEGDTMNLVTIVLNKTECLESLLHSFAENGIKGATILESTGMAHALSDEMDLKFIASLRMILDPDRETSKTIFLVADEKEITLISKIVNEVTGGLDQPDTGIMFCTPVTYMEGLVKNAD